MYSNSNFTNSVYNVLITNNIIQRNDPISVVPCYKACEPDKNHTHFIIKCENSNRTMFLKSKKSNDYAIHYDKYIKNFRNDDGSYTYPAILVPTFTIEGQDYYITSYIPGDNLDSISHQLSNSDWSIIAKKLLDRLNELSQIKESKFFEKNSVIDCCYADYMQKKIKSRFQHPIFKDISERILSKAIYTCYDILLESSYSVPSLIHMDIKPANIIWDRTTGNLGLVDFELARFGDIDYGWAQILLSGINRFSEEYKTNLIPKLTQNCLSLEEAQAIPKFQCYLFYQVVCNLIYYYDRRLKPPKAFVSLFKKMLTKLSGE